MKKLLSLILLTIAIPLVALADEGMWLVNQLERIYPKMRERGLKLELEEVESLTKCIAAIDGGMGTGSLISENGLLITNHHVAYSDICALSTPEKNYLEWGFIARNQAEELPVSGKSVMLMHSVEDISEEANHYRDSLESIGKWGVMGGRKLVAEMERRHTKEGLVPWCARMWDGRLTLLIHYIVYEDVRLVAAPPHRIGAFGGEVDNWGWPQHKGDFAIYRIYTSKSGKPAKYSEENTPLKPEKWLTISSSGVKEDDFSMILGYPGRTHRYGSEWAVEEREMRNPIISDCRHKRMEIIRNRMESDSLVRLAYSDSYFSLSNYADYTLWESKCLARYKVKSHRQAERELIESWVNADSERKSRYGELMERLERGYNARQEAVRVRTWYQETWFGPSRALIAANRVWSLIERLERNKMGELKVGSSEWGNLDRATHHLAENYDMATDRELFIYSVTEFTRTVPRSMWGEHLTKEYERYAGDAARLAGEAFDASFCRSAESYTEFLSTDHTVEECKEDPLVAIAGSVGVRPFAQAVLDAEHKVGIGVDSEEATFRRLQYDYREAMNIAQYPDANSTMRLTYGRVRSLVPRDGVHYNYRSTIKGYLEKESKTNYDFHVDSKLHSLIAKGDWGCWGEDGVMYVDYLTDNDITGGNSGSPMLDSRGRLVGLAFDGNRESMAGDVWFHPELSRTVAVDIRFVMWLLERYLDADYLIKELNID